MELCGGPFQIQRWPTTGREGKKLSEKKKKTTTRRKLRFNGPRFPMAARRKHDSTKKGCFTRQHKRVKLRTDKADMKAAIFKAGKKK